MPRADFAPQPIRRCSSWRTVSWPGAGSETRAPLAAPEITFAAGVPHGSDAYWRLNRAHLNTLENLPIFAAIVLSGWVVGMESAMFNRLAVIVVANKDDALLARLGVVALFESVGTNVAIENVYVCLRGGRLNLQGILDGVGAAHS